MRLFKVLVLVLAFARLLAPAAPLKNLTRSGWAQVNGGRLYYEVYGRGTPLVFLHAGIADSRMWDRQVTYFSRKYTVVRFDARGYGQSEPATGPYVPADDTYSLLKFLGINRACIIGLSIGGTHAIDLAVVHPEVVSALVVAGSPGWLPYSDQLNQRTSAIVIAAQKQGLASMVEGWMNDPMLAVAKTQSPIAMEMRMFLSRNTAGILGLPFMRPPNVPSTSRLSDLQMPVLVMVGDRDDPEIVEHSRTMKREIPGAREVILEDADHMVNLEKPREFNRALDEFLNGVKRR